MDLVLSWSGGKDSCLALEALCASGRDRVSALLTTINARDSTIGMHGVPVELLREQARALDVPLVEVDIAWPCTNVQYEAHMRDALAPLRAQGVEGIAFGDLFLEDIRAYRDKLALANKLQPIYPLWGEDTAKLIHQFIDRGFRAVTCCVDLKALTSDFAGRLIDEDFLAELPPHVDPCGENGEFHSFVVDGPAFRNAVGVKVSGTTIRDGFAYADLEPAVVVLPS